MPLTFSQLKSEIRLLSMVLNIYLIGLYKRINIKSSIKNVKTKFLLSIIKNDTQSANCSSILVGIVISVAEKYANKNAININIT